MRQVTKISIGILQIIFKTGIFLSFLFFFIQGKAQTNSFNCNTDFHAFKQWQTPRNPRAYNFYIENYSSDKLSFSFDFGDGTKQDNVNYSTSHVYTNGGSYKVCLTTVNPGNGCTSTTCNFLSVTTCFADFTYTMNPLSNSYNFTPANNTGPTDYLWTFWNGTISTSSLKNPIFQCPAGLTVFASLLTSSKLDPDCHDTVNRQLDVINGIGVHNKQQVILENYPNPFSGTTTIHYTIRVSSAVEISVFDLLGNRVDLMQSDVKAPGDYSIEWNSHGLEEGMYLLQLKTADLSVTKKMVISN
jgi:hypothetical protein